MGRRNRRSALDPDMLPPGAIVREILLPAGRAAAPAPAGGVVLAPFQPVGSLVARFGVEGRPVPWSVPPKVRRKNPRLAAWQLVVRGAARLGMLAPGPYPGPIELVLAFHLRPRYANSPRGMPDLTNLQKGLEDALNGICYADDCQVVRIAATKHVGRRDGADVEVYVAAGGAAP